MAGSVIVSDSLSVLWTDAATNTAGIRYSVVCSTSGESYNSNTQTGTFSIDGESYSSSYTLPRNSDTTVFSRDVIVGNASGRTIYASYSFPTTPAGGTKTGGSSVQVPDIPRYANFTEHYVSSTGLNSISVKWSADSNIDSVQYSLNGGGWTGTSGSPYTISNLNPNTTYSIRTRIKRADSQLWTESGTIYGTTKDIARITAAPNINHGDNLPITITNPSGSAIKVGLYKSDGTTVLAEYRSCSGSSYTFNFTDEELDNIYKQYGVGNTVNARAYIKTANTYTAYRELVITLTGNQKVIKIKNNNWRRGKLWIKSNGAWRKAVVWKKIDGTWRRAI